jgi:hypothetical protein
MAFQHAYIALTRLRPVCYQPAKAQQVSFELSHILILPSCNSWLRRYGRGITGGLRQHLISRRLTSAVRSHRLSMGGLPYLT